MALKHIFINPDFRQRSKADKSDTILLDSRIKYENDKAESFSLFPSGAVFPTLSSSGPIRESRAMNTYASALRFSESGGSMVEMLGALAIIGVLSIVGIIGYNWAINKYRANTIYNDIKLAYMDVYVRPTMSSEWQSINFKPASGYDMQVRRDVNENNFVKVSAIQKDTCEALSEMAEDGEEMTLYHLDSSPLTCDEDTQDIVASFTGEPPVLTCKKGSDCPDYLYCDTATERCTLCPLGLTPDADQTGCENLCDDQDEVTCISETEKTAWCCPYDTFCSEVTPGACVVSDGVCIFNFHNKSTEGLLYSTNCSYYITTEEVIENYSTDCAYHVSNADVVVSYGTDCAYDVSADGSVTRDTSKTCSGNQYCLLKWTAPEWTTSSEPTASAGYVGKIYGKCQMMSTNDASPIAKYSDGASIVYPVSGKNCSNGEYCLLKWTDETWDKQANEPKAVAGSTGILYGKCQMMSTNDGTPIITYKSGGSMVYAKDKCQNGEYCLLKWTEPKWPSNAWPDASTEPTASAGHSGLMYGKCQIMSTNDGSPIVEKIDGGNATYTIEKECPAKQYCHLQWSNTACDKAAASITGPIYGACARLDEHNTTCPEIVDGTD